MGPLSLGWGASKASLPGGCAIGGRPINIHLEGFRRLGAEIELAQGYVDVSSKNYKVPSSRWILPASVRLKI